MVVVHFFDVFWEAPGAVAFEGGRSVQAAVSRASGGMTIEASIVYSGCCRAQCGNVRITLLKFRPPDGISTGGAAPEVLDVHQQSERRRSSRRASRCSLPTSRRLL